MFKAILDGGGTVVGLLGYWRFEAFTFLEHITVSSACRGSCLGTSAVQELQDAANLPLIFEADLTEMNSRVPKRIRWYESLGFNSNQQEFAQPEHAMNQHAVPSGIMSYPHRLSDGDFEPIRQALYSQVNHYVPAN